MSRLPLVFMLAVALAAGTAHADGKRDKNKALALFEQSDRAYKAGKFEDAARLLRDAYQLYPEPILLYNLGRAQEGLGDTEGAIESYERYLDEARELQDRGAIERRIETLKTQLAEKQAEAARLAEEEARRKQAEEERARAEAERLRAERRARASARSPLETYGPWITIGTGGALLATGFFFGIHATTTHDDAVAAPIQRDAVQLQASAERSATIANAMFVVGGLVTAGGIGWKVWLWQTGTNATAQLQVSPGGVALGGVW